MRRIYLSLGYLSLLMAWPSVGFVRPISPPVARLSSCDSLWLAVQREWQRDSTHIYLRAADLEACWLDLGQSESPLPQEMGRLARVYSIGVTHDPLHRGEWLWRRASLGLLAGEQVLPLAQSWALEAIHERPDLAETYLLETALEGCLLEYANGKMSWQSAVMEWAAVDRAFWLGELRGGPNASEFARKRAEARLSVRAALPDCSRLEAAYGERLLRAQVPADSCRAFLHLHELQGCEPGAAWRAALDRVMSEAYPATTARMAATEAYNRGAWEESRRHWLRAVALEAEPQLRAADQLQVAQTWLAQRDYRQARAAALAAAELHPGWGEPLVRLMDIYSAGAAACGGGFDRQAVHWLLIELCHRLLNTDPNYTEQAHERLAQYQELAPSAAEAGIRGFKPGDSYPLKCWMSTTTTVPLR